MTININNCKYTDNTLDIDKDTIFVASEANKRFHEDAKKKNPKEFIFDNELKKHINIDGIKVLGITGTNGKTTTAAAIYSLLLDLGFKVALQGTRGFFINENRVEEYSLTTPVQLSNFEHIHKAKVAGCEFFIMEVSSHAIVQNRIEGLDFALKILTNITRDHLDFHKSIEEYINVKNSFFSDDSVKLINKDEKNAKYNSKNGFSYGLDNPSTYKVDAYSFKGGMHVAMQNIGNQVSFSSHLMGLFNVYNLCAAISAVHILTKIDLQKICDELENFGGVSGRMEVVSFDPYVIVDFAHTPDGMKEVYESFKHLDIITVFGAGGDRDREKRPLMGKIANNYAKTIIVTSDNPRFEDPDLIIEDILSGIANKEKVSVEINRKEAIKKAISLTNKNNVCLVLGKGDEEYQIIYDKKFPLNDKNIIKNLLQ